MPLRTDLLNPIPGDNPAGTSLRYEPVRDEIKEARREEQETPQGVWKTEVKAANWNRVVSLASDVLVKRSKDLQVAVWLVEAHARLEGFPVLQPGFEFLHGLIETYWDNFYPEVEDGDLEERASILSWLGTSLGGWVRQLPILRNGFSWISYRETVTVGSPADASSEEARRRREKLIADGKPTPDDWEAAVTASAKADCEALQRTVKDAAESLAGLNSLCDERFGRDAPSFGALQQALEDIGTLIRGVINKKGGPTATQAQVTAAVPPAPVAAAPEPVSTPTPVAAPEPVIAAAPLRVSTSPEPADVADAESRLASICRFLRNNDMYDIAPFLILRGLRFGQLRYNGPDQIDASMLVAPAENVRQEMASSYAGRDWDGLLVATERAMALPCGRGWLDIQFYTVRALEGKGQWFAFVADAVRTETRGLLTDLPALLDMKMTDGSPAASAETRAWIENEVLAGVAPAIRHEAIVVAVPAEPVPVPVPVAVPVPVPVPVVPLGPPPLLEQSPVEPTDDPVFDEAVISVREGQLAQAIQTLTRQLDSERSGRKRFVRRVQMAHLLMNAGQTRVALPLLEQLASEIESRNLEAWEDSAGLAYPLSLLVQCLNGNGACAEQRSKLFDRICRLDPVRALGLGA